MVTVRATVIKCREWLRSSTSRTSKGRTVIHYTEETESPTHPAQPYSRVVIKDGEQDDALTQRAEPDDDAVIKYRGQPGTPTVNLEGLPCNSSQSKVATATPLKRGPKGPMPKRRFQEGAFRIENGHYYSFFYRDRVMPDGGTRSVKERFDHGKVAKISELSARREHDRLRQRINRERGSVPTTPKGETFGDASKAYVENVAPQLSVSTIRQRKSHLRCHLIPRFGSFALTALDVSTVQGFATELLGTTNARPSSTCWGLYSPFLSTRANAALRLPMFPFPR